MDKHQIIQSLIPELKVAMESNKSPAFVFDRISDKPQESKSLEFQGAHARRYVAEANLHTVFHFSVTESGWSSEDRKRFRLMLDLSEQFGIKDLVFKNTDRLSRNLTDILRIQELYEKKDYRIHFFENHQVIHKGSNYNDKWNLELLILVAKRLSDKISHDMKESNAYKIGKRIAPGRARLGYVYDKEKRIHLIDPAKEPELRWIFDEFDTGKYGLTDFTDLVNAKGIKNLRVRKWHRSRLHDLLTSPFYHGEFLVKRTGEILQGNHQIYYEKERYLKRIERLSSRYYPRTGSEKNFHLTGLLRCSCGSAYFGDLKKGKYVYYSHPCKHRAGTFVRLTENEVFQRILLEMQSIKISDTATENLKFIFKERVRERNSNTQEDLRNINSQILDLTRKKSTLFELYAEEGIGKADLTAKIREYESAIEQLRKQQTSLSKNDKDFVFKVAGAMESFKNFPRTYELLPSLESKVKLLRQSVSAVNLSAQKTELVFKDTYKILYKPELLALGEEVRVYTSVLPETDKTRTLMDQLIFEFQMLFERVA